MRKTAMVALGFAAAIVAAPAFAECPGHTGATAQGQSTPAPVAQSTPPATVPAGDQQVILTQNDSVPPSEPPAQ